ncbi:MAG TPA: ribose-5-phosphate isomerase RpiA [Sphingobium sp.]|nr:ribose-5-phosphate isomerase RpiA [Sphingobium sp.]
MDGAWPRIEDRKRAAAQAAVDEVRAGMLIGLGTGSTATFAIAALAHRIARGLAIRAVATSMRTAEMARQAGIPLLDLAEMAQVDLGIDGVDEIDPAFRAIKGAGGAMLSEKIVASAARRMIAIADDTKAVARLGARPVPVEVLPVARAFVAGQLAALGCVATLRRDGAAAPARTDHGNIIFDCQFDRLDDPAARAAQLASIPGVLGHGLFLTEIDTLYLGTADGVVRTDRRIDEN